jgi:tetratricopeptide (TPR) repeat protein
MSQPLSMPDAGGETPSAEVRSGSLEKPGLSALLRRVSQMSFSGVLYLRNGVNRRRLYETNGALVLATSTVPGERMGDYLLSREYCTAEQLSAAVESSKREGATILDVLDAQGVISGLQHGEILCRLTEKIVYNSADWKQGVWELVPGKLPPEVARPSSADMPLWNAMLTQYDDWRRVVEVLADTNTSLVLAPDALKQASYKELDFASKQLLSHFSRERAIHQVARGRVMNPFDELLTLARCVEMRLLRVMSIAFSEDVQASEEVEPEATLPLDRGALAAVAAAHAGRLAAAAQRTKLTPRPPEDSEEARSRRKKANELRGLAREQNRVGGDLQKGLDYLKQAMLLDPALIELPLEAAEMLLRNPRRVDEAESYCRKALAIDPESWRAHLVLGKVFIALRNPADARRELALAGRSTDGAVEAAPLLATLSRDTSRPRPRPLSAMEQPRSGQAPAVRGLAAVGLVVLLGAWGFGLYHLVLWRIDAAFGPAPARTVYTEATE